MNLVIEPATAPTDEARAFVAASVAASAFVDMRLIE